MFLKHKYFLLHPNKKNSNTTLSGSGYLLQKLKLNDHPIKYNLIQLKITSNILTLGNISWLLSNWTDIRCQCQQKIIFSLCNNQNKSHKIFSNNCHLESRLWTRSKQILFIIKFCSSWILGRLIQVQEDLIYFCRAPHPILFGPLPVPYPLLTRPLPIPYLSLTFTLQSSLYRNSSCHVLSCIMDIEDD